MDESRHLMHSDAVEEKVHAGMIDRGALKSMVPNDTLHSQLGDASIDFVERAIALQRRHRTERGREARYMFVTVFGQGIVHTLGIAEPVGCWVPIGGHKKGWLDVVTIHEFKPDPGVLCRPRCGARRAGVGHHIQRTDMMM